MLRRYILLVLLLPSLIFAQNLDSLLNILKSHENDDEWLDIISGEKNYHLIYFQATYENDSYFAGRDIGLNQYNLTAQATYSFKQLSLTAATIMYESLDPPLQAIAASVNYRLPLKFPINVDINYDRYFFLDENDTLSGIYPNGFGLGLSYSKKFWGASLDASLLTGEDGIAPQIKPNIYGQFNLFSWNSHNSFSIKPELAWYFGSELTALTSAPGDRRQFAKPADSDNGQGTGSGNGQGDGPGTGTGTGTIEPEYMYSFGLMNTEINIYLLLEIDDFDMSFGFQNNSPRAVDIEIAYPRTSMVSFSMGYAFSFLGK